MPILSTGAGDAAHADEQSNTEYLVCEGMLDDGVNFEAPTVGPRYRLAHRAPLGLLFVNVADVAIFIEHSSFFLERIGSGWSRTAGKTHCGWVHKQGAGRSSMIVRCKNRMRYYVRPWRATFSSSRAVRVVGSMACSANRSQAWKVAFDLRVARSLRGRRAARTFAIASDHYSS